MLTTNNFFGIENPKLETKKNNLKILCVSEHHSFIPAFTEAVYNVFNCQNFVV